MADLPQSIRAFLVSELTGIHVGEDVPQSIGTDYIWFQRQGDMLDESLCHPPVIDAVIFDFECVSTDISQCRTLTNQAKAVLMNSDLHEIVYQTHEGFDQTVHCFDVEDHDDNYIPHTVQQDAKLHIGAFRVTAHLGQFV